MFRFFRSKKQPIVHVGSVEEAQQHISESARAGKHVIMDLSDVDLSKLGEFLQPVDQKTKLGRNDPCPCGSGVKYKKCCLRN